MSEPRFFKTQGQWRAWLEKNHAKAGELLVGFHKAKSAEKGMTYKEAVDEALCFGWIDAVRGGGELTWTIRFTPRKAKSIWSQVNIKRVEELKAEGRVHATGLAAYTGRDPKLQNRYSFEVRNVAFDPASAKAFRANPKAWAYFSAMPLSYRRPATWWVMSAKRDETKVKRLKTLIADSSAGRKVKPLRRSGEK